MSIEKILFPTRFRGLSYKSLEPLFALKDTGLKEIVLCHVIPRQDVYVPFGGYMKDEEEKLREQARIRLEDWQRSMTEIGIDSRIEIVVGEPVPRILNIAEKENVDMIIVGRETGSEIAYPFIGSTTVDIITRSRVPAIVSKYMVRYEINGETYTRVNDRIFERPMFVTNWTGQCDRALHILVALKDVIRKAICFHNINVRISKKHDKEEVRRIEKDSLEKLNASCGYLEDHGIKSEYHLGAGEIMDEILNVSRDRNASMIIMGTTGKDRWHELFYKSISHDVARLSELPILLVP